MRFFTIEVVVLIIWRKTDSQHYNLFAQNFNITYSTPNETNNKEYRSAMWLQDGNATTCNPLVIPGSRALSPKGDEHQSVFDSVCDGIMTILIEQGNDLDPLLGVTIIRIRVTNHERGVDQIAATCYELFGAAVSPSHSVAAYFMPSEHEGEGFYELDVEVPVGAVIPIFHI